MTIFLAIVVAFVSLLVAYIALFWLDAASLSAMLSLASLDMVRAVAAIVRDGNTDDRRSDNVELNSGP